MRKLGHELFSRAVMTATEKTKVDTEWTHSQSLPCDERSVPYYRINKLNISHFIRVAQKTLFLEGLPVLDPWAQIPARRAQFHQGQSPTDRPLLPKEVAK
jgi:hypothetical protein